MGRIQKINKARKERKCGRCGKEIKVGDAYFKGTINFHPDVIRCTDCKLQAWEVTSSEYILTVGEIAYRWEENFSVSEEVVEEISGNLEEIRDEQQDKLDNLPENLQESPTGELLQGRIDNLDSVISDLEGIDMDELLCDDETEMTENIKQAIQECLDGLEV